MATRKLTEKQTESLTKVIDYNYSNEKTHFEETFDVEIDELTDGEIITLCEKEGYTDHVLYDILILMENSK
jgi:hypothetical protein